MTLRLFSFVVFSLPVHLSAAQTRNHAVGFALLHQLSIHNSFIFYIFKCINCTINNNIAVYYRIPVVFVSVEPYWLFPFQSFAHMDLMDFNYDGMSFVFLILTLA